MKRVKELIRIELVSKASVALLTVVFPVSAASSADFYEGATIQIYVGFGAGGSYDGYSRLVSQHLGRHIPGKPEITVSNMPGAGGLKAANYLYAAAPQDGTALGVVSEAAALEQILGTKGIKFDASKFNWIGRMTSTQNLWFGWSATPATSIEAIRGRETIVASSGRGVTSYMPIALNRLAGTNLKIVTGYRGSKDVSLALEREEVEVGYGLWSWMKASKPEWVRDKKVTPLFVSGGRISDLPDVASATELGLDEKAKEILRQLGSTTAVGRSLVAPPGVPDDRVKLLRGAFIAMVADSRFLADAKKRKMELDPLSGEKLQEIVGQTVAMPDTLRKHLREAVQK